MLMITCSFAKAQNTNDRIAIIQQIIDHPDLTSYYPADEAGNTDQRYIMQYPYSFSEEVVNALPASDAIIVDENSLPANATVWLRFRGLGITPTVASGVANLFLLKAGQESPEVLTIYFELHKSGDNWEVSNFTMGGSGR